MHCADDQMGGVISDLLEATCDLAAPPLTFPPRILPPPPTKGRLPATPFQPVHVAEHRGQCRRQQKRRPSMPRCTKDHHRLCQKNRRRVTFAERLERFYELDDPRMVERSSTPTGDNCLLTSHKEDDDNEEEYGAWTSYLRTPGTFHGQLKPQIPGAFSGMCFPQTDPRWICHHPHVPAAVKSIIN